jgi:RNA polymerase sigma factor (sigma-70 family)
MSAKTARVALRRKRVVMLSAEEEYKLLEAWLLDRDYDARAELVRQFRPLAARIAASVAAQSGGDMIDDLRQEAMTALIETLDKYLLEKKTRFGVYARVHIEHACRRYTMDQAGPTRVATNLQDKKIFFGFRKMREKIERETGEPLSDEGRAQIAHDLGVSLDAIKRMEPRIARSDLSVESIMTAPDEDSEAAPRHHDALTDKGPSPEEICADQIDQSRIRQALGEALAELDPIAYRVVYDRRLAETKKSYAVIGEELGREMQTPKSRKQVQQIEAEALGKLRDHLTEMGFVGADVAMVF